MWLGVCLFERESQSAQLAQTTPPPSSKRPIIVSLPKDLDYGHHGVILGRLPRDRAWSWFLKNEIPLVPLLSSLLPPFRL